MNAASLTKYRNKNTRHKNAEWLPFQCVTSD